jgi:hypothetical protein
MVGAIVAAGVAAVVVSSKAVVVDPAAEPDVSATAPGEHADMMRASVILAIRCVTPAAFLSAVANLSARP